MRRRRTLSLCPLVLPLAAACSVAAAVPAEQGSPVLMAPGSTTRLPAERTAQQDHSALARSIAQALHVDSVELVLLDVDRVPGKPIHVSVPIAGIERTLDLSPMSVRAPGFRLLAQLGDGSYETVAPATPCTLRGSVAGMDGSTVAAGVLDNGLYATVQMGDGAQWWIQPAADAVTPELGASLPDGLHVLYNGPYRGDAACTTTDHRTLDEHHAGAGTSPLSDRGGSKRLADLAVDAEYAFFQKSGSLLRAAALIELLVNISNVQFERDVDIAHEISAIIVRTVQIYQIGTGPNLVGQVRTQWNAHHTDIQRDLVLFLDGNGAGGQAFITGGVCDIGNAYAGVGVDPVTLHYRTDTISHELGHLWGACHCPCANPAYTMNWIITGANRFGSTPGSDCGPSTVTQIVNHRNSRSCLIPFNGTVLPNDLCAQAIDLPCAHTGDYYADCAFGFSNIGATQDGPSDGCRPGSNDIWYRFVPRCDTQVRVHTCIDATFDTVLMAYDGRFGCPTDSSHMVGCNDDSTTCPGNGFRSDMTFPASAGVPYFIRVAGFNFQTGGGILEFRYDNCPRPFNDSCVDARVVAPRNGYHFTTVGALTGTWVQPTGIPHDSWLEACGSFDDLQLSSDVWFTYVAPCAGSTMFSLCGSSFDTKMALYSLCPTGDFQALACNDDNGPDCTSTASSFRYSLIAGASYLIRVGGHAGAAGEGFLTITPETCPGPFNDHCTHPLPLAASVTPVVSQLDGFNAGVDGQSSCIGSIAPDFWYEFVAPTGGIFHASTCGTLTTVGRQALLSLHSGCPGVQANELSCATPDSTCGYTGATIAQAMTAGQRVLLRVALDAPLVPGTTVTLTHRLEPDPPANDTCAGAFAIGSLSQAFSLQGATPSTEGQSGCGNTGGPDIWFRHTPSCTSTIRVNVCNTTFPANVAVFNACGGGVLSCVDAGNQTCGSTSTVTFPALAGLTYFIRVAGAPGAPGTGDISVTGCNTATGACCTDVSCFMTTNPLLCSLSEGTFRGRGTVCPPPRPDGSRPACCAADVNGNGLLTLQDLFDYLTFYFSGEFRADFNNDGLVSVQDLFDFLAAYFAGCPA